MEHNVCRRIWQFPMRQFEKALMGVTKTATRAYTIRETIYSTPCQMPYF